VLATMTAALQRSLATAVVVGMLTLGAPMPRPLNLATPPAVVRVQLRSAGAEAWHALFPDRLAPN